MEEKARQFYFGAATSAHQVEGNTHNDWSEWEKANAKRLAEATRKKQWPDFLIAQKPSLFEEGSYISGAAADHYNRFEEDFKIAKQLDHTAHRFSIEWSRIEPEEGQFDQKEIEHYAKVIKSLRTKGIEPFVTLWHWTNPLWLAKRGGPEADTFAFYFARYARCVAEHLGGEVRHWMTLNEPTSVITNAYLRGIWPPQKRNPWSAYIVSRNLARAHVEGYKAIKELFPTSHVGFGHIMQYVHPVGFENVGSLKGIINAGAARIIDFFINRYFLRLTGDWHDYMALQYYFVKHVDLFSRSKRAAGQTSDMGWELYPEGIYYLLASLKKYNRPIYITENGLADARDTLRSDFIKTHLVQVKRAMQEGADARGYFYWSLLDNFEWDKGFWPRFGLIEIDYATQKRTIRPSAHEYTKSAQELFGK